jgi:TrmH family RNA methyltransferase
MCDFIAAAKSLAPGPMPQLRKVMAFNADPSSWPIASKAKIAVWRKLRTQKSRKQSGQLAVEGVRLVAEALLSGFPVEALIAADCEQGFQANTRALESVRAWTGNAVRVPVREFRQLTDTTHSAGVAAIISWRPLAWDQIGTIAADRLLFCDRIADPGNMGTLIRTAAGIGLDAVLAGPDSVEITNPKTMRASAGAVFRIPVFQSVEIESFVRWSGEHRHDVFIADARRGEALAPGKTRAPWTLVVGGEIGMIDPAWNGARPSRLSLPMKHGVDSFNAAVAGAILMDRLSWSVSR